jgi:hypothetical protein
MTKQQIVTMVICAVLSGAIAMFGGLWLLSAMGRNTGKGDSPQELFVVMFLTPISVAAGSGVGYLLSARKK